jgi:flagellar biogenesis protein FliO
MEELGRKGRDIIVSRLRKLPAWGWGIVALLGLGALTLLWDTGQSRAAQDPFGSPDWSMFLGVMLKLGVVLALIYVGLFLLKKWRLDGPLVSQRRLELLETLRLSPKQAVHLIHAEGRVLVLGATDQTISLLIQWPDETAGDEPNGLDSYAEIAAHV